MSSRRLTAVLHHEEDMYVGFCPEIGTVSQGKSVEEALANLKEATELYLKNHPVGRLERALLTTFDISLNE